MRVSLHQVAEHLSNETALSNFLHKSYFENSGQYMTVADRDSNKVLGHHFMNSSKEVSDKKINQKNIHTKLLAGRQSYASPEASVTPIPTTTKIDDRENSVSIERDRASPESKESSAPAVTANIMPGTEAQSTLPAQPCDGIWPFQLGYAFFMKKRYYCNVSRNRADGCKHTFLNRAVLIQHLSFVHQLTLKNAMDLRESEDDQGMTDKIVDMILSTGLPSTVVENPAFNKLVRELQGSDEQTVIVPSVEVTRKLIYQRFEAEQKRIKQILIDKGHVAYSIHVCHSFHDAKHTVMIVTVFYMNESWELKDQILSINSLDRDPNSNTDHEARIRTTFLETIQRLEIDYIPYTVTLSDADFLDKFVKQEESPSDKPAFLPCLDQILLSIKECLLLDFEKDFEPLSIICNTLKYINEVGPNVLSPDSIPRIKEYNQNCRKPVDFLTEFPPVMEEIARVSRSSNLKKLTLDEMTKILRTLHLVTNLDDSLSWLDNALEYKYPTANKTLIICNEIMDCIYQVARCYGCKDVKDLFHNNCYGRNSCDRKMLIKLHTMYLLLRRYHRTLMQTNPFNPFYKALLLDTFVYNIFKGREQQYLKPDNSSVIELLKTFQHEDHISSVIQKLSSEMLDVLTELNTIAVSLKRGKEDNISPNKRLKRDIGNNWKLALVENSELGYEGPPEVVSTEPKYNMQEFQEIQRFLLQTHKSTYSTGCMPTSMLSLLFSKRYNFALINFWKIANPTYYPELGVLTRQCFSIPTTSNVCTSLAETAKAHYFSLLYLSPSLTREEIQYRTLMHFWENR
ncbi:uncharacterized protein EV154DRAFT_509554 [Mucor mucedo]|uniref:uncharacterized protein n=1 Tax=Mucor mucedo TaxID=29922 RepID=UPI00221FFF70|nr:uncharacterized protein EV154DRAFT_509554 [Mucor mucedo]KAI7891087.1 hypothetical protein EV154DRAFT_509554 [Mucor mucedo]